MDLPSLRYRRVRGDMIETYKYTHSNYTVNEDLVVRNEDSVDNVTALILPRRKANNSAINVLLNAGAGPSITDADGYACRHAAAWNDCCTEVFQGIISHGGDVNATNKNNTTALMIACEIGNKDAINVLLNAGADLNIADAGSDTCVHDTALNDCCTEVLHAIIDHGADVNATNKTNVIPLLVSADM